MPRRREASCDPATPNPGVITFTDPDTADTHTASWTADASNTTSFGSFHTALAHDTTGTGTGGQVNWTFDVIDGSIHSLGVGESVTQKYDVVVQDNFHASATQVVTVTINGANDAAVVAAGDGYGRLQ